MEAARIDTESQPAVEQTSERPARGDSEPRFVARRRGRLRLLVAPRFEAALRAQGFGNARQLRALALSLEPTPGRGAGRAAARVIETSEGPVFSKRALKGGVLAPFFAGRVPRFARAVHEIEVTATLRARGAPVLEPVVAAGVRDGLGWLALVGTRLVPHAVDGATALADAMVRGDDEVGAVARRLGEAIRSFHDAGGHHADLAITNLLVEGGPKPMVRVIDLQGARAGAPPSPARRRRELARLARSIERRAAIRPALDVAWPALASAYEA